VTEGIALLLTILVAVQRTHRDLIVFTFRGKGTAFARRVAKQTMAVTTLKVIVHIAVSADVFKVFSPTRQWSAELQYKAFSRVRVYHPFNKRLSRTNSTAVGYHDYFIPHKGACRMLQLT